MLQRLNAVSQETLEVFVESPDAGGGSDSKVKSLFQNLKPSNIKQKLSRDRSIDDSTDVSVTEEPFSDNGSEQDGQLDGQIFTVGVAYAQVTASPRADVQTSLTAGMAASHVTACAQVQRLQAAGGAVPVLHCRQHAAGPCNSTSHQVCEYMCWGLAPVWGAASTSPTLVDLQVLQVDCKGSSITIYYHPNSLRFTQSVRVAEANSWRFTVTLDTPEASCAWPPQGRSAVHSCPSIPLVTALLQGLCFCTCTC